MITTWELILDFYVRLVYRSRLQEEPAAPVGDGSV